MKKEIIIILIMLPIICLLAFYSRSIRAPGEYYIVKDRSTLDFEIKNLDGEVVYGKFNEFSGNIFFNKHNLENFNADIDIQTVSISTDNVEKDGQLRGLEFLDAVNFPTISFTSRKPLRRKIDVSKKHTNYEVIGSLIIKGRKVEIIFPVFISGPIVKSMGRESVYIEGERTINRRDLDDPLNHLLNDKYDSVKLIIMIEAEK